MKNEILTIRVSQILLPLYKVCSRYRPGMAQRVGEAIALLFHGRSTRRGWVVSSTPWPHFTHRKDPVPILQEAGWAPWPVWTGGKSRPHRDSIPDRPVRSQSLYQLSYPAHLPPLWSHKIYQPVTFDENIRALSIGHPYISLKMLYQ